MLYESEDGLFPVVRSDRSTLLPVSRKSFAARNAPFLARSNSPGLGVITTPTLVVFRLHDISPTFWSDFNLRLRHQNLEDYDQID
jgi:hypothetical protein